jgi:hypothetical protein
MSEDAAPHDWRSLEESPEFVTIRLLTAFALWYGTRTGLGAET